MGDLSKHFSRSEFACKCNCGFDTVDAQLLDVLVELREEVGPITINSACRCPAHNVYVGGSAKSQHVMGRAADIVSANLPPGELYTLLVKKVEGRYGLGTYDSFTHIDTRSNGPARW